jgi:hypothetical protein
MKIAAFTALHYGTDYFGAAIASVAPYVDEWLVAYSPEGSHGTRARVRCPESEYMLRKIADHALEKADKPLVWWSGLYPHEGAQRDTVLQHTDADLIIVVDADEVWQDGAVQDVIRRAQEQPARVGLVPFIHFWRSFSWVCRDDNWPVRVIQPKLADGTAYYGCPPVLHFGYARKPEAIEYKMRIHGHRSEWRPEWYVTKFMAWTPQRGPHEDLHPTNKDFWTAEPFAKEQLPQVLRDHPYYALEVI